MPSVEPFASERQTFASERQIATERQLFASERHFTRFCRWPCVIGAAVVRLFAELAALTPAYVLEEVSFDAWFA